MDYTEAEKGNNVSDAQNTFSQATQELPSQEKEANINFAHTKGQENSSLKRQNSDFSDNVSRKKQRTTDEIGRQESTELNSYMESMVSSHSSNESTKLEDRDISPTGLTVRDEWSFCELTKPNHEVSSTESNEKYLEVSFDILEYAPSREVFNPLTGEEKGNLSSGTHPEENQISSGNDSILINSNSCGNMQVEPNDAIFHAPIASKNLDIESEKIKNILNLEILSLEFPNEIECSFDIKKEDVMEINSCTGTLTNNDEQCKLDQIENAIDVIMYDKEMENGFNEEKYKNKINGCTSSLCSTDKIHDLDEIVFSAQVVGNNISSCFNKVSNKLANEISAGYEDTLFPPVKEMVRDEPSTSKLDQNKEVIDVIVHDKQIENIFNAGKYHNKINDCTSSLCSTDKIHNLDKTNISAPVDGKNIIICFNKVSDKLENEISTCYAETVFQQLEEMVREEPPKFSTNSEDISSNDREELLSATLLVGQNCEEFSSNNEGHIECENINEQNATFLIEIENSAHDSNKYPDISPQHCEEISSTSHSLDRSNLNDLWFKRSLLSPLTVGEKRFPHYSQPSATVQKSNLIQQVITEFLENRGQQAFTVQDVVNFVMQEFGSVLSYFDAIHSARIFLRNAVNAKTLKLNDGKYVIKSSVERII